MFPANKANAVTLCCVDIAAQQTLWHVTSASDVHHVSFTTWYKCTENDPDHWPAHLADEKINIQGVLK